jgi:hypothetical protein
MYRNIFVALTAFCGAIAQGAVAGGANYYYFDSTPGQLHHPIVNYNNSTIISYSGCPNPERGGITVQACVQQEMGAMYDSGMRRMRITIPFFRGGAGGGNCPGSGTIDGNFNSSYVSGGGFSPQCIQNLITFLQNNFSSARWQEVEIGFFPGVNNDPGTWGDNISPYSSYVAENWAVIQQVRAAVIASGITNYHLDLGNENAPPDNLPGQNGFYAMYQYVQTILQNYVNAYGSLNDTVGFSVACDPVGCGGRTANMLTIMAGLGAYPPLYDVHIYDNPPISSAYSLALNAFNARGQSQQWIIGEASYNDASEAATLQSLDSGNQRIKYLTEWPLDTSGVMNNPPFSNSNYQTYFY